VRREHENAAKLSQQQHLVTVATLESNHTAAITGNVHLTLSVFRREISSDSTACLCCEFCTNEYSMYIWGLLLSWHSRVMFCPRLFFSRL